MPQMNKERKNPKDHRHGEVATRGPSRCQIWPPPPTTSQGWKKTQFFFQLMHWVSVLMQKT